MLSLYNYGMEVDRVIDGDTIVVIVDLGFHTYIKEYLRFYDVNTPETRGVNYSPEGAWATLYTDLWLRGQENLWTLDRSIDIKEYITGIFFKPYLKDLYFNSRKYDARGKYGRALAEIFRAGDNISLNSCLLQYYNKYTGANPQLEYPRGLEDLN
jgi:endonuclease YncB( thermonuclease family)